MAMAVERTLDGIKLLAGLEAGHRRRLAELCSWRPHVRSSMIVSSDAESTDVHFLAKGRVRVTFFAPNGREVKFRDLEAGSCFGELAAIDGQARSVSVVALDDSVVATITRAQFWRLVQAHPAVAAALLQMLASVIRDLTSRVVDTTTLTVPARVRQELMRRVRERAGPSAKRVQLSVFPTHADLASLIGATREAVSREFSRLAGLGLVERRGRDLVIHDVDALAASVEEMREI